MSATIATSMPKHLFDLFLTVALFTSLLCTVTTALSSTPQPDAPTGARPSPSAPVATVGPTKGTLLIVGGGNLSQEIWKRFVDLAGGSEARIVFVPTAGEGLVLDPENTVHKFQELGVKQVTTLHTRDPKEADTEAFVAPLKTATGVWFDGGRQWRLADAYLHTRTHTELNNLLERGGVIGGTSAGATIQGSFLVRGDTKGNELMEGDHLVGLGFLKNVAIDQHILSRNRQFDLIPVIEAHPELLGIGIDENTAIVVQGDQFEVIGASYVAITDHNLWGNPGASSPNHAANKGKFYLLGKGQKFDLSARKPVEQQHVKAN
jgi:cyanophycinase